ncbi:hypothetical protein HTG_06605 [Natrinema mahii]|nr:hypothetical protein HTG_06605 [Natrinema mahii]
MTTYRRRTTLGLLGAGMAFLAGCSGSSDDGNGSDDGTGDEPDDDSDEPTGDADIDGENGDLPAYASILPQSDDQSYFYGAIDGATLDTLLNDEGAAEGNEPTDPLLGNPVIMAVLFGSFGSPDSREAYLNNDRTAADEGVLVDANGVYAVEGRYDRNGLVADLESAGYTAETETDAYALYSDADTGEAVGVSDEVFAVTAPNSNDDGFEPVAAVERVLETAVGDREPKHAVDADFEWLLRASSTDGMALCRYTETDAFDPEALGNEQVSSDTLEFAFGAFEGANGVHQQLSLGDGDATASAVVTYADEEGVDRDRLESALGTDADSVTFEQDGSAVAVDAEYSGDLVEE